MPFTRNTPSGGADDVPTRHHLDRRAVDLIAEATGDPHDLLTTSELSEWLGMSTQFFEIARSRGYGPRFVRMSARRVRYMRASVLDWLREREHQHTREYNGNGKEKEKASA
jgi:predicted DNA-binding transcriptional regulator AlpA